jgi:N-acetylglucosaminyl-diphospho-decaprenol L-rhamnosyltransferase
VPQGLTVVLIHWNQPERCVRTELVVVDNGSDPAAVGHLRRELPAARLIELGRNTGFGPAANAGLRWWLDEGEGDWAAIAPHDALPEPECLPRLLDAVAQRPQAGLASAEYGEPGKPVVDRYFGGILVDSERRPGWEDAGHPHGTLMLLRRQCLLDVGLFDERYFAYCEEADLGERARRAGWEVGVVWGAVVRNPSWSVGSAVADYLMLRNSLLLVRQHFGVYPVTIRFLMALGSTAVQLVSPSRRPPVFSPAARVRAMGDFLRGRFGPPPEGYTLATKGT